MHFLAGFANSLDKYDLIWLAAIVFVIVVTRRFKAAPSGFWDNFWAHLSIVTLFSLFVVSMVVSVHLIHMKADAGSIQWAEGTVTALILAITQAFGLKNVNSSGKSTSENPTPSTTNGQPKTDNPNIGKI